MNKPRGRKLWPKRSDLAASSIIFLFFGAFFLPVFSSGKFFVIQDNLIYFYPLRTIVWQKLRHGELPLWTPLIHSGYPLLSMAQLAIPYPLTWGYLFLPGYVAEQIFVMAPFFLAPLFTYAYAREIGRSRLASLLAGLTFGYGGAMVAAIGYNGMMTNAVMWLPLILIALERARAGSFRGCLLGAAGVYSLSMLTGHGQGIFVVGIVALAYGLFLALATGALSKDAAIGGWLTWNRWRPLAVVVCALLIAAGVGAFQILETMQVQRLSIRRDLSYQTFAERSFAPLELLKSFVAPLYHIVDATAYVAPLAFGLATIAIIASIRKARRDARVWFWTVLGGASLILMLGEHISIYRLLYHVPVFNLFRVPARHAFEWTFALGILAAYGWDTASKFLGARATPDRCQPRILVMALLCLLLALTGIVLWRTDIARVPVNIYDLLYLHHSYSLAHYLGWKTILAASTIGLLWVGWQIPSPRWRRPLFLGAIVTACFAEPSVLASRWWWPALNSGSSFTSVSPTTRFLKQYPPENNRIYTRSTLFAEDMLPQRRLEPGDMTVLHGLQNVTGYEPLILERYSRALGNAGLDGFLTRPGYAPDKFLLESRSHVLDLLNTRFLVGYSDLLLEPNKRAEKDGLKFRQDNLDITLKPGELATLPGVAADSDTLSLVTTLAYSETEAQGAPVAKVRLVTADGRMIERELQAGRDSAEWAHDAPELRNTMPHSLAPIFDSNTANSKGVDFPAHRYWTRIPLGENVRVTRMELVNVSAKAWLAVWKATLYDSRTHFSMPLPHYDLKKWQPVYDEDDVVILRNQNALPRLWLVAQAEAVTPDEALSKIRGEGAVPFDPRRTALLEVRREELPQLPGGSVPENAQASFSSYADNRISIATAADIPTMLIVGEVNYPGWVATVDGVEVPIHTADFLLRGVALTAGAHTVEMRYTAPSARRGAIISLASLLLMGGLAIHVRRFST